MHNDYQLIRFDPGYLSEIMRLYNDMDLRPMWSNSDKLFEKDYFEELFYSKLRSYYHSFRILLDGRKTFLGFIYSHELNEDHKQVFLSAVTIPECPRGLMADAVLQYMEYLFDKYQFDLIKFDVIEYNEKSIACFDSRFFNESEEGQTRKYCGNTYGTRVFSISKNGFDRLKEFVNGNECR